MIERQNIFPEGMPKRIVKGHVLYEVRRLSHPDFLIEVEVMAVIPER